MKTKNWIIFSLGGSLVFPEEIDTAFFKKIRIFILKWLKKGEKFIIFIGGREISQEFSKSG